jgi:phosphoesterase RecJ-like protein
MTFLDSKDRILLVTHENPDGDGIGAMLGLAKYLFDIQKKIRIVITPNMPDNLTFLDYEGWVEVFDPKMTHKELATWPDAIVLIDAHDPQRMGSIYPIFETSNADKACLDHHLKDVNIDTLNKFNCELNDSTASASAELVFDLISRRISLPLPLSMAEAIYTGIADDTGNFKFSNSTAKVHRIVADLIEQGVAPAKIYQNLYNQGRPARLKIFSRAFDSMIILDNDRYVRLSITRDDLNACGADYSDLNGLVNYPIELRNVEISCLLCELPDGQTKASLRSRGKVNVQTICKHFGGGGHRLASGMKIHSHIDKAQNEVDAAILAELKLYC